ncbi:hypothetical protein [Marinobacter segnicrescens]|uniref:hypothetical protein n=1 Tax=Marinobacter segnicrescens TaxID=430453 RepID=UPI003A927C24
MSDTVKQFFCVDQLPDTAPIEISEAQRALISEVFKPTVFEELFMFGINANLKKTVAIATIAVAGIMGAANASAQQYVMEEMLEQQLQERAAKAEQQKQASETADTKADEKADSNAS